MGSYDGRSTPNPATTTGPSSGLTVENAWLFAPIPILITWFTTWFAGAIPAREPSGV